MNNLQSEHQEDMNKQSQGISDDVSQLATHAKALMAATADVAGDKVGEARQRLAEALARGREYYDSARTKAVQGAKAADVAVHQHPYQAIAIGFGIGAILGFLVTRRSDRHGH